MQYWYPSSELKYKYPSLECGVFVSFCIVLSISILLESVEYMFMCAVTLEFAVSVSYCRVLSICIFLCAVSVAVCRVCNISVYSVDCGVFESFCIGWSFVSFCSIWSICILLYLFCSKCQPFLPESDFRFYMLP